MDNGFLFCRWRESKKKAWSRICGRGNLFFHHGTQFFQLSEWHEKEFDREWKRKELKPDKLAMLFVFNSLYTFWAVLFFTSLSSLLTSSLLSVRLLTDVQALAGWVVASHSCLVNEKNLLSFQRIFTYFIWPPSIIM